MKKIHAIVKYFHPVTAGIETNMRETYSHIVKSGYEVTVHTSKSTLNCANCLKSEDEIKGIKIQRYPWRLWGFLPKIPWEDTDILALHNYNIVPHSLILCIVLWRKLLGKKNPLILLTPHGGFTPDWGIFSFGSRIVKITFHKTLARLLINYTCDFVRAVSKWEANEMIDYGILKNKIVTIENGLEDEAFGDIDTLASNKVKDIVRKYKNYCIQIGRIYPIKNYETAIRAIAQLSTKIYFFIVGPKQDDDSYQLHLESLANSLGIGDRVFFMGVFSGYDKYYLIRHAKFMVHMARWESFCNVVHEGMSQGLPILAANNTALPLLIKNFKNGFCIDTYDVPRLTDAMKYVLDEKNSNEILQIAQTNIGFGKHHSWKSVALRIVEEIFVKHSV